jgi:hypothetical protein
MPPATNIVTTVVTIITTGVVKCKWAFFSERKIDADAVFENTPAWRF